MTAPNSQSARRGGPPVVLAVIAVVGLLLGVLVILFAGGRVGLTAASPTIAPVSDAAEQTAGLATFSLGQLGIQVQRPQTPYRPGESPTLATAPRIVLQAITPDDPTHGYIMVYDLGSTGAADTSAREYASYLGSGVGRVQFPTGTKFVLQRIGSTLIFYSWTPGGPDDQGAAAIARSLQSIGDAVPVPS